MSNKTEKPTTPEEAGARAQRFWERITRPIQIVSFFVVLACIALCAKQPKADTLEFAGPVVFGADQVNQPSVAGVDLGMMGAVLNGPEADLIQAITDDMLAGDFARVGVALSEVGLPRIWWEDNIEMNVLAPSAGNPHGWEFDLLFTISFPASKAYDPAFACTLLLPPLRQPGGTMVPAAVSAIPMAQCWDTSLADLAAIGGMQTIISNSMMLDVLFPPHYSIFGDGPVTNANGTRSMSCAELRWASNGGVIAGVGGGVGAGATAMGGVASSGIIGAISAYVGTALTGMVLGEVSAATAAALLAMGSVAGVVTGGLVVVGVVIGAAIAARAAYATAGSGCPGCNASELAGEECRVIADECVCKDAELWVQYPEHSPERPDDGTSESSGPGHALEEWARREMRATGAPRAEGEAGGGGISFDDNKGDCRAGSTSECDAACRPGWDGCTVCTDSPEVVCFYSVEP